MTALFFDHNAQVVNGLDLERIEGKLYEWVNTVLGIPVQWARQGLDRPAYPYASLDMIAGPTKLGEDESQFTTSGLTVNQVITGKRAFTLSVQVHVDPGSITSGNDRAVARCEILRASLKSEAVLSLFREAGVAVSTDLGVLDLTQLVADQWLDRASFDLRCEATAIYRDSSTYIETVETDGTLGGAAGGDITETETLG